MNETRTSYGASRRFWLDRERDETGVSGTGVVAEGIVWADGSVALRWMKAHRSTAFYDSLETLEAVHLHHGATKIRWKDPICFCCGSALALNEIEGRTCLACGSGQGTYGKTPLHMERDPDPSLGSWSPAIVLCREDEGPRDG